MFQKSFMILFSCILLSGCTQINNQIVQVTDKKTDIKICLMREAQVCIQDGSAFATPIRTTAKKITKTCINEVIPESEQTESVSSETRQMAQVVLTTLIGQNNE